MINIYDVLEMIKMGEGWKIDFKADLPKPAKLAATYVAFANHQGGTILFGIDNKGKVVGFKATKEDKDNILRAGRDGCRPAMANLEFNDFTLEDKSILAVSVPEGTDEVYATSDGISAAEAPKTSPSSGASSTSSSQSERRSYLRNNPASEPSTRTSIQNECAATSRRARKNSASSSTCLQKIS